MAKNSQNLGEPTSWLAKLYQVLLVTMPAVLYFSYFPVISLGENESMNFELSLPLIWLVLFDVVVGVLLVRARFWREIKWWWLGFPLWATLTVGWSLNLVRGVLTAGIMWLVVVAVYGVVKFREAMDERWQRRFWRVFWLAGLVACAWCAVQCVLDIAGVPREASLMCAGCVSEMFGFPHPNGWAIEPQFMGNLLIAPALVSAWLVMSVHRRRALILLGIFTSALFLTFSRGAIYAFLVGIIVMGVWRLVRAGAKARRGVLKRRAVVGGVIVLGFAFTLNLQGIMAAVGPTNDTYLSGVAKALNQLSLGIIDLRGGEVKNDEVWLEGVTSGGAQPEGAAGDKVLLEGVTEAAETEALSATSSAPELTVTEVAENTAVFDGYVVESTDTRLRLTGAAIEVWRSSFPNVTIGVGLGAAGQALYNAGLSPAPKEIIQNEYANLLLETGLIGVILFVVLVVLVVRYILKFSATKGKVGVAASAVPVISLLVAYAVTLLFFSGLPNALQIYLLPAAILVFWGTKTSGYGLSILKNNCFMA